MGEVNGWVASSDSTLVACAMIALAGERLIGETMKIIHLRCASLGCREILAVSSESRGQLVTCKYCKRVMRVPLEKTAAGAAAPVAAATSPHATPTEA